MDYDIAIIGLGPAGSTLARLLSPTLNVVVIEQKKQSRDNKNHKPCIGLLSRETQKQLIQQNLSIPMDVFAPPNIFSVRLYDINTKLTCDYPRYYVSVDRDKFDHWLRSIIPATVTIHYNTQSKNIERTIDGYQITYTNETHLDNTIRTRYVVGADGANSMVRQMRYPNLSHKLRQYIAIQQWFEKKALPSSSFHFFDNQTRQSHAWLVTKQNFLILGGAFAENGAHENFEKLKNQLASQGFNLGKPLKTETCGVVYPNRFHDIYTGNDNIFLIGEAAGFISTSSFDGISYALRSAEILSHIFNIDHLKPNKCYYFNTLPLRLKLYSKMIKAKIFSRPLWRRLMMKSGMIR